MPTFDAGSIASTLELDRSPFSRELDEAKAQADEFSKKHITATVDLDSKDAGKQLSALNRQMTTLGKKNAKPVVDLNLKGSSRALNDLTARLDKLAARTVRPDVDLGGIAKTSVDLKALQAQLTQLNRQKATPTVKVDTKQSEQGLKRLLDAALALAPALVPIGGAAVGGAVALGSAFLAAGVGVGAFALAAAPAIKKISDAEDALNTAVQSRTAAQKKALTGLSTSESGAAKEMLSLVQTYAGFSKVLEPTTFTALSKGADIAKTGLHDIAPIAHTTGDALIGLETDLKKALDTKYTKNFFAYLGVEAPKAVGAFGHSIGNVGLGFAGILQAFTPVEHQLESGIEGLSKKFANFGKGAGSNQGLSEFIAYVQQEGPKVIHLIGQFGSTFAQVAKDAAPLGAAELQIVSELLGFVDAEAKAHPKLIELALGVYTANKAIGALKVGALLTGVGGAVGSASSGKGLLGLGAGLVGLASGSKALKDVFPKVASATGKVGTAATGARVGMLSLGEAFGGAEVLGVALTGGVGLLAAGVGILGYEMTKNGSAADQFVAKTIASDKAVGNNIVGYQKAQKALESYTTAQNKKPSVQHGYNPYSANVNFETDSAAAGTTTSGFDALSKAQQNVITGAKKVQGAFAGIGPQFALTTKQALALADANGLDMSKGFDTSTAAGRKNATILAQLTEKAKENAAVVKQSHDPTAQFAADIKQAGDTTQTADQQVQGLTTALTNYQSLVTGVATSSAAAGDALANMAMDFTKGTTSTDRYNAAQAILSGNLLQAGPQTRKLAEDLGGLQSSFNGNLEAMFKNAVQSGHTASGFQEVTKQAGLNRAALIHQLTAMGLSASEAKKLADKYAAIPHDITTKARLLGAKAAESDADDVTRHVNSVPKSHTTQVLAATKQGISDLEAIRKKAQNLPKKEKIQVDAYVDAAEGKLRQLRQTTLDLTNRNKPYNMTILANAKWSSDLHTSQGGGLLKQSAGGYTGTTGRVGVDSIPALLAPREFTTRSAIVDREGVGAFHALNAGKATIVPRFAEGGQVNIHGSATGTAGVAASESSFLNSHLSSFAKSAAKQMAAAGNINYKAGAGVAQWASLILKALAMEGQPSSLLGVVERRMNQESGGNPNAINLTDSNAKAGHPSKGLMQTIPSTFAAYHWPGSSNNIYDPLANILASMGYAISRYGSLAAAYNRAGGYANGGNPQAGEVAWVGEQGKELVQFGGPATVYNHAESMRMAAGRGAPGFASGGKITSALKAVGKTDVASLQAHINIATSSADIEAYTNKLIDAIRKKFNGYKSDFLVTFVQNAEQEALAKQHSARDSAGAHLLDAILAGFSGSRAQSTIKASTDSIIHSIDADFKGTQKAGLVSFTERVNGQMLTLAKQRDKIATQISAANDIATGVKQGAQQFASLTNLGGTAGPADIQTSLGSKLAAIRTFASNIAKLSKLGLSKELIAQITAAGVDGGGPIAQQLVTASRGQISGINKTQTAIDKASISLGNTAVNTQIGGSAAKQFVAGLKAQEGNLEKQMTHLGQYLAKGIGHQFHLPGYASGGSPRPGLAVVGERGPEIVSFGAGARVHSNAQSQAMTSIDYNALAKAIVSALPTRTAPVIGEVHVADNMDLQLAISRAAFVISNTHGLGG